MKLYTKNENHNQTLLISFNPCTIYYKFHDPLTFCLHDPMHEIKAKKANKKIKKKQIE